MRNYLVCYDVADPKRLSKVRKIVYAYALGGQKSAIEAPLSEEELRVLVTELHRIIKPQDKINIIEFSGDPICVGKADFLKFDRGAIVV